MAAAAAPAVDAGALEVLTARLAMAEAAAAAEERQRSYLQTEKACHPHSASGPWLVESLHSSSMSELRPRNAVTHGCGAGCHMT